MLEKIGPSLRRNGGNVIIVSTLFTVFTTIAVALRLLSNRFITKIKFGWSERLLVIAQIVWYAQYAVQFHGLFIGRKMEGKIDHPTSIYIQSAYIGAILYFALVYFTNLSILFLYRRLFPIQSAKRISAILMILHTLWFVPGVVTEIAVCSPPSVLWLKLELIPEKCILYSTFFMIILPVELLLDAIVLAVPVFYIINLKLPWARRAELIVIFLLGGVVIVAGIVRIVDSAEPGVQFRSIGVIVFDIIWLNIHCGLAIICACLPTYRPLIVRCAAVISSCSSKVFSPASGDQSRVDRSNFGPFSGRGTYQVTIRSEGTRTGSSRLVNQGEYQKFGSEIGIQLVRQVDVENVCPG